MKPKIRQNIAHWQDTNKQSEVIYTQTVHKFNFILQVVDFLSFSLQQPITEWYNLFHSSP